MLEAFKRFSSLVVLPHSVFALPFALAAFELARQRGPIVALPRTGVVVVLVIGCVVAARSAAMAFNRIVDRFSDARNPRTRERELPRGVVSLRAAWSVVGAAGGIFLLGAWLIGWHTFVLAPAVLGVLLFYSVTKRFTAHSHLVLGLALGLAPAGAWWVLRPVVELTPILFTLSVMLWVAGFDIIYSCQDADFDRREGLHSLPQALGIKRALQLSELCHSVAFVGFLLIGASVGLAWPYYVGSVMIGLLLWYQHRLVTESDLTRVNRAFFTVNGFVSIGYLVIVLASV